MPVPTQTGLTEKERPGWDRLGSLPVQREPSLPIRVTLHAYPKNSPHRSIYTATGSGQPHSCPLSRQKGEGDNTKPLLSPSVGGEASIVVRRDRDTPACDVSLFGSSESSFAWTLSSRSLFPGYALTPRSVIDTEPSFFSSFFSSHFLYQEAPELLLSTQFLSSNFSFFSPHRAVPRP